MRCRPSVSATRPGCGRGSGDRGCVTGDHHPIRGLAVPGPRASRPGDPDGVCSSVLPRFCLTMSTRRRLTTTMGNVYPDKDRFWRPVGAGMLRRPMAWRHGNEGPGDARRQGPHGVGGGGVPPVCQLTAGGGRAGGGVRGGGHRPRGPRPPGAARPLTGSVVAVTRLCLSSPGDPGAGPGPYSWGCPGER